MRPYSLGFMRERRRQVTAGNTKPADGACHERLRGSPITILLVAFESRGAQNSGHPLIRGRHHQEVIMVIRSQKAQGLAEYALILALIAIAAVLALLFLSGTIQSILSIIGNKL
jgi:pilus assembly protein Flp/PilA